MQTAFGDKSMLSAIGRRAVPGPMEQVLRWRVGSDVLSLAGGMPDPTLLPTKAIESALDAVLARVGAAALQYGEPAGLAALRARYLEMFCLPEMKGQVEDLVITYGAEQAIYLVSQLLLDAGDQVVVTAPSYFGALQIFAAAGARIATVGMDQRGVLDLEGLAQHLRDPRTKLIYLVSSFQNPTGLSIPEQQRPEIVSLARRHGVAVLEDDVFGELCFGKRPIPLRAYDPDQVIYVSSFSKILAPGLRTGFLLAPTAWAQKLVLMRQYADVCPSALTQYLALELLRSGQQLQHLQRLRKIYGDRAQTLIAGLQQYFSLYGRWTVPKGGMFAWLYLDQIDTEGLLHHCLSSGLVFMPGSAFYPEGKGGGHEARLTFATLPPVEIRQAVKRLADLTAQFVERTSLQDDRGVSNMKGVA